MAHTTGKVIGVEKKGWAQVITERTDACSGCQVKENCHSCLTHTKIETRVLNVVGAKTGDLLGAHTIGVIFVGLAAKNKQQDIGEKTRLKARHLGKKLAFKLLEGIRRTSTD